VTDDFEKRLRAALDAAAADVEPTGTLADLRARIRGETVTTHLNDTIGDKTDE
jgi:hypothetical protein